MDHCRECYEDPNSLLSIDNILQCQKASDVLISLAYFSIPLELLYFVLTFPTTVIPIRWILVQFIAFIVLCGLTHLLNAFTFAPHSFTLMLSLTAAKFLTALVSITTAISLLTLIPQLLRVFIREGLLRKKARDLDLQVGIMKRREEASSHVRMLTREIRRSLDRHTILHTTLLELSNSLLLHRCSVWMPSPPPLDCLLLAHEVTRHDRAAVVPRSLPSNDPDVATIIRTEGAVVLRQNSALACAGDEDEDELAEIAGSVAAIRLPLLKASNFKSGASELRGEETYAVLVLVPAVVVEGKAREWTMQEMEIVEAVADQVVVALSHAAVLEESLAVRKELMDRNTMLKHAREDAETANKARNLFEKVIGREMAGPVRLVGALFSALQLGNLLPEQSALAKGGSILASIIEDASLLSRLEGGGSELKLRPFSLLSIMKDAAKVAKLLCALHRVRFECRVPDCVSKWLVGDERRILEVLVYMVEILLESGDGRTVVLCLSIDDGSQDLWKQKKIEDSVNLGFKVERVESIGESRGHKRLLSIAEEDSEQGPGLSICRKLAKLMHSDLSANFAGSTLHELNLHIRLQQEQPLDEGCFKPRGLDLSLLKRMRILLVAVDDLNKSITMEVLEKSGCDLITVPSWQESLETLFLKGVQFHLMLIDVRMLEQGSGVSGRVRKLRLQSWPLIVVLVQNYDEDIKVKCLQAGVHGVLCYPIIIEELLEELQRLTLHIQATPRLL